MHSISIFIFTIALTFTSMQAQHFNQEINSDSNSPVLLGKINQEALSKNSYGEWFGKNKALFTPNVTAIQLLEKELPSYTIKAFMGTWCGDSKREVPKFYKVLDEANFPIDRLTMVAVSRERSTYKQSPGGEEEGLHIHRVPTFIVYKDGKEVNRIVESPIKSIEEDLLDIIKGDYTPNYASVEIVANQLDEMGVEKFQKKVRKLAKRLQAVVKSTSELSTYSYTLFQADRVQEAVAVATLNTLLFPSAASTYVRLANQLSQINQTQKAKKAYESALKLDPENEAAKKGIIALQSK